MIAAVQPAPPSETAEIEAAFDRLWPLLRSITGAGVRQSHDILGEFLPLTRIEVPTGTAAFDWTVPAEWVVREAYVIDPRGRRILDVADNNLHLLNYSIPFRGRLDRAELDDHLHSLPDLPDAIPYVTSYYEPRWGFCIAHNQRLALPDGEYQVVIDTDHIDGAMTISEAVLPGDSDREVLFSTYTCHPSLANNELSGPLVTALLYRRLAARPNRRLTYRFLFAPETIGSIVYLSNAGERLKKKMVAGYVLTCIGDDGRIHYKRSRRGNSIADRAAEYVLRDRDGTTAEFIDFFPSGSDERQYCSPGFNLPVGSFCRTMYGAYPEYHTSLDNRDVISFDAMVETADIIAKVCETLEMNVVYENLKPYCEPHLGRYGLYPTLSETRTNSDWINAIRWLLNLSDGTCDLLAIAKRSGIDIADLDQAAQRCLRNGLIEAVDPYPSHS